MSATCRTAPQWKSLLPLVGIGGAIVFLSALLYFLNWCSR